MTAKKTVNKKPHGFTERVKEFLKENRTHIVATCLIVLSVLVANGAYVLGFADPNPALQRSGLATTVDRQDRLPGLNTIDPNDGFVSQALGNRASDDWLDGKVHFGIIMRVLDRR